MRRKISSSKAILAAAVAALALSAGTAEAGLFGRRDVVVVAPSPTVYAVPTTAVYAAPVVPVYSAPVVRTVYEAPASYVVRSAVPTVYSAAPTVYETQAVYEAPGVYATPTAYLAPTVYGVRTRGTRVVVPRQVYRLYP